MAKTLFLVHKANKNKIKASPSSIIFLDESGIDDKQSISYYAAKVLKEKKDERYCYNTFLIQKWAFQKNIGNKSFAEELVFDNITLWYPVEFYITCDFGQMGYELSTPGITYYIDVITRIIKEQKPDEVLAEKGEQLSKIIRAVCAKEKIRFSELSIKVPKKPFIDRLTNDRNLVKQYLKSRFALRKAAARIANKAEKKDLLILTSDRLSNKHNKTDYFWGPIVKELEKRRLSYKVVEYDRPEAFNSLVNLKKRYLPQRYDAQFIGTYYDASTAKHARMIVRFLRNKFKQLDRNNDFRKSFNYEGINFYEIIKPRLEKIFLTYSYYIADVYALSKSIIEKEKPKAILVDHEKNFYGRALISYAKQKNIPSYCTEGELVFDNNTYLLQEPIKIINDKNSPLWRPLADNKFLWGSYNQEWHLSKNSIPKEKLMITGSPKYDALKELSLNDRKEIRNKYKIANDEKLIAVISAHDPGEEEFLAAILKAFNKENKIRLIIKMHPLDTIPYISSITSIAKKSGVNAQVITFEDSTKLIYASDWVITCPSTLVYDSVLLNKKITLYGKRALRQPYVISGLLKTNLTPASLSDAIKTDMKSKTTLNQKTRAGFIKKYLYSDDGKASRRAVDVIEKVLKR
ncbi:CDP-glycerol glycerophosphotransferase family protein [Candidatus Woesearchaeota archaeon]|nr:CDP-glycerol glycerophosphotransferase family protein [Candidatus Woesearchaeota archaeon]